MKLRLSYFIEGAGVYLETLQQTDDDLWWDYLNHMATANPDTIFFLTTASTDIF